MEQSLYSDPDGPDSSVKLLKRSMTLDFSNSAPGSKKKKLATVLASPDLNMLKLASPELEKMIIQANGMVTTTPTPTQFIFPKFVTEEQEAYARGFVDALAEIQNSRNRAQQVSQELGQTFTSLTVPTALPQSAMIPISSAVPLPSSSDLSATTTLPGGPVSVSRPPQSISPAKISVPSSRSHIGAGLSTQVENLNVRIPQIKEEQSLNVRIPQIKEEPQTVPCMNSSPPLSPINMESQEKIKVERKRARNRLAARKCRTRKLEKISRLEDRVNELKGQNGDLVNTATSLRDQVVKLKQQIVEHVNSGCQIMLSSNISI